MKNEKSALRKAVFAEIDALPEEYITSSDEGIYNNVIASREFQQAKSIFVYYSVGREPDTHRIIEHALSLGKTVALPLCFRGGVMEARAVRDLSTLRPGVLDIPAPPEDAPVIPPGELDLVIVPSVAYDKSRYRLGYGGGYYDRYLRGLSAHTMGIARARCIRDLVPREDHDLAVNCVVTENGKIKQVAQAIGDSEAP